MKKPRIGLSAPSLGPVRLNAPLQYHLAGWLSLLLVVALLLFMSVAKFGATHVVRGNIDATKGVLTITNDFTGIVSHLYIKEGDKVKAGQTLLVIKRPNTQYLAQQQTFFEQRMHNLAQMYQLKKAKHLALLKLYDHQYLADLKVKEAESELLALANQINSLKAQYSDFKNQQTQVIKAPIDGIVTNILFYKKQHVHAEQPLLHLLPAQKKLQAVLYVPVRDIGFLRVGQTIYLHYDAYPVARFGSYEATITLINQTVLTDSKEDKPLQINEPYYKVTAHLAHEFVTLYGKHQALYHGMVFSAHIPRERKTIWQWMLDPIYSYYG